MKASPQQVQKATELLVKHPIVKHLSLLFQASGFSLYLVGGCVRDALIGQIQQDFDFATDATPEEVIKITSGFADNLWLVGLKFGTVGLEKAGSKIEITTFREEFYPQNSRHPEVKFARTIETDLSRRDFTINAMAIKLPEGQLVDPFNGLSDLAASRIKTPLTPEQSFTDDPLRMVRAVRFVSTLGFTVAEEVLKAIVVLKDRLQIVSKERVCEELTKLLTGTYPSRAIALMVATSLAEIIIPELIQLAKLRDPAHRHKDVLKHTLKVVEAVPNDLVLRLAALLHDIGKPATITVDADGVHFYHHEIVGAKIARRRLRELRFPVKVIQDVTKLIELHMRFHTYRLGWSDKAVRKFVREVGPETLPKLNQLVRADCTTQNPFLARKFSRLLDELEQRIAVLEAEEESAKIRPPLDGHEVMEFLNIKPGPLVGKILNLLLEARLEEKIKTKKDAKEFLLSLKKENKLGL